MRDLLRFGALPLAVILLGVGAVGAQVYNTVPPGSPVKLIFIHHSTGEAWLEDGHGGLGIALRDNSYFVSDTNYGWGPADADVGADAIGDHTDIGHWYNWFSGPHRSTYMAALLAEADQHASYSRLATPPAGPNRIVMFKSCFPNAHLGGEPSDTIPPIGSNPLRGMDAGSGDHTIANAKGIYLELLNFFATRQDTLFVAVVPPPLVVASTDATAAANARAFASWLVTNWLSSYPHHNVFVFDFYNVLTSNGGATRIDDPASNDLGWVDGNHHRFSGGAIQHLTTVSHNFSAYGSDPSDSHPTAAGDQKATGELVPLLNLAYHCWQGDGACPPAGPICTVGCTATVPATAPVSTAVVFAATATPANCSGEPSYDWDFGDGTPHATTASPCHTYPTAGPRSWHLTVTVDGAVCTRSGTITITGTTCTLECAATVPATAPVSTAVAFAATATPTNCAGEPSYDCDFGDGSPHAASPNPSHTYLATGLFSWTLTATVNGVACTRTGTIGITSAGGGTTYYVRTDGGSRDQCTGVVDAAYPGSGTGQPCAWDHLFRVFPPGETPHIVGGDTVIVGPGELMIGHGAPGADTCDAGYSWDCYMSEIPAGPDAAHPTRILGKGWDTGCANPPQLWGTERVEFVLNLYNATNVEVACLEITDHSGCVEFHSGALPCNRDVSPFGPWAVRGIAAQDSANVVLRDLDIHGLAGIGVHAGRLADWTLENVRIAANGWVGWDGDIDGVDSNSGTLQFRHWTVEWNGCGETYPGRQPTGCWAQTAGGYGDGVGTGETAGTWVIEDSTFAHNTSDGLDLLYARSGSSITIRRTLAVGNAGNQIKTNGPTTIQSSVVVGNCGFFDGKPFTFNVDNCRAAGNALSLTLRLGDQVSLFNNTVTGEGDCLVLADCDTEHSSCNGTEAVRLRNTMLVGHPEFGGGDERTCLAWPEGFPHDDGVFDFDYSLINGVKNGACPGGHALCAVSPGIVSAALATFDAHLLAGSAAVNAGTAAGAPSFDFDNHPRDATPDIGAFELATTSCTVSCTATVPPTATVGFVVPFAATATPVGCAGEPGFDWDFGDGSAHASLQNPSHVFLAPGSYPWTLTVTVDGQTCSRTGTVVAAAATNGDADGDGLVTVTDVFYLVNFLFAGGPGPLGPADVNGSGAVGVDDVFYLINYLFAGGPAPAPLGRQRDQAPGRRR